MKQFDVFPECNVDTNLVGYIIGGYAKHKSCCNEVVKAVNGTDCFAVGIIDEDKRQATLHEGFREVVLQDIVDGEHRHIKLYIHDDGKRYMFTVKPAMDKFIFDAVKAEGVDLAEIGFPKSFNDFKKMAKRIQSATNPKLRKLFDCIKDYPELMRFRNTLKYLILKQYDADTKTVRSFFEGTLDVGDLSRFYSG